MSRQLEIEQEEKQTRANDELLSAVEFALIGSIAHIGGTLRGLSIKLGVADCLLTLRAEFEGVAQVCFVGAPDISSCLRKAVTEAYANNLKWRDDQFQK